MFPYLELFCFAGRGERLQMDKLPSCIAAGKVGLVFDVFACQGMNYIVIIAFITHRLEYPDGIEVAICGIGGDEGFLGVAYLRAIVIGEISILIAGLLRIGSRHHIVCIRFLNPHIPYPFVGVCLPPGCGGSCQQEEQEKEEMPQGGCLHNYCLVGRQGSSRRLTKQ